MRAALLSTGKARLAANLAFPLLTAKDEGLWNSYYTFREALREKCSLLTAFTHLIENPPVTDPGREVARAIESASAGTFTLNSSLPSIARWADDIERSAQKNISGLETALSWLDRSIRQLETDLKKSTGGNDATVYIEDLPSILSADERSDLRKRLSTVIASAEETMRNAAAGLMKKHGIISPPAFSGSYGSFADIVREYPVFNFTIRMKLMNDLADTYGKNSESPAGDCVLFEDILMLQDKSLIKILRYVDTQDLAIALKNADDSLRMKVYSVMTKNAADLLGEDIEFMGKVRKKDSNGISRKIARVMWRLYSEGELELPEITADLPGNYSAILKFVLELIPLIADKRSRSIRQKQSEMLELLAEIEDVHDLHISKITNDWNRLPGWEITPDASGEPLESVEKAILAEVAEGETTDYIRALMPEDILNCLDYRSPLLDFNELPLLADSSVDRLIRTAPHEAVRTALKGLPEASLEKILNILPRDLHAIMTEELSLINPSNEEIEMAKREIMELVQGMAECGEIIVSGD